MVIKAWHFATQKHTSQTYGGHEEGIHIDYLNHLGLVTMEIMWCLSHTQQRYNADVMIQCAILHDTIEDTNTTYAELESVFGREVANGVLALTKNKEAGGKELQMKDSLNRILNTSAEISTVKVADRITNLYRPPYYWNKTKIESYIHEARIIHETLTNADEGMRQRLQQKIDAYHVYLK